MRNGNMFRLESVCTPKEHTRACVEQRAVTCKLTIEFISKCQQKRRKNTFIVGSKKIPSEIYFSLANQFMHIWIEPFICIKLNHFCQASSSRAWAAFLCQIKWWNELVYAFWNLVTAQLRQTKYVKKCLDQKSEKIQRIKSTFKKSHCVNKYVR